MIKPIEISEIPNVKHSDIIADIEEFSSSDADACEIVNRDSRPPPRPCMHPTPRRRKDQAMP